MDVQEAYQLLYSVSLIVIAVLMAVLLIRTVASAGVTDRLLCKRFRYEEEEDGEKPERDWIPVRKAKRKRRRT